MNRNTRLLIFAALAVILTLAFTSTKSVAQENALPPIKVVHIGDSYSAGNGARTAAGDRNYIGVEKCFRSPTNWGSQFVDSLGDVFAVTYVNRACSGGVIENVLNPREMDKKVKNLDGSCPTSDYPDEEFFVDDSTLQCTRYLNPQIDAVDESVDLVIMTMGGNDVKFASIVKQCFVKGFRDPTDCRDAVQNADTALEQVENDLTEVFNRLRSKLRPDAKVIFITYPYLAPDVDFQLRFLLDTYNVAEEVRNLGLEGDRRQRAAVETANDTAGEEFIVFYDGTKSLFEGHIPNPLQENAEKWLFEPFDTRQVMEWYHFNPLGHHNLGTALSAIEAIDDLDDTLPEIRSDLDVAFVVDTTGSMGNEIAQVRADLSDLVDQLAATTSSYRVAVVSYRDFPERTDWEFDYPSRIDQTFTDNLPEIQAAIDSLIAEGGGDDEETVFSGIQAAIDLPWRPGVTKVAIVIGDAPALSPEPISGLTSGEVIANSIAIDPVQVIGVNVRGGLDSNGVLGEIAGATGGEVVEDTAELTATISAILEQTTVEPFAWIGGAYSGRIGEPVEFDASGSYDPSGLALERYEWDFDGDGEFDLQTESITVTHTYTQAFNGYVVVRVTGEGGTALASARAVINTEGFAPQGDEEFCALDDNGISIFVDDDGQYINCIADSLPDAEKEGVEVIGDTPTALEESNEPIQQRIFLPVINQQQ